MADQAKTKKKFFPKKPSAAVEVAEKKVGKAHDPSLPILQYGGRNHASSYLEWKKAMTSHCQRNYGNLAKIFHNLREFLPPEVVIPVGLNEDNDPGGYIRQDIREQIKSRRIAIEKMREHKPAMYSTIWLQLSLDSEQAVKKDVILAAKRQYELELEAYENYQHAIAALIVEHGNIADIPADDLPVEVDEPERLNDLGTWKLFEYNADPLSLLQSIQRTHLSYSTEFQAGDKAKAREDYSKLRQGATENVMSFRERTEACLECLRAANEPVPSDEALAADFIRRLHSRFDGFKVHLENSSHQGLAYPDNLETAYILASQFKIVRDVSGAKNDGGPVL